MRLFGRSIDIVLPCGLRGKDGRHSRDATLVPMNGAAELLATETSNPFLAAHLVLSRCLTQIGGRPEPGLDIIRRLLPLDRDVLMVELDSLTFGPVRFQTMRCPLPDCRTRMDIELDLSTASPPDVDATVEREIRLDGDRRLRLRLPNAGDQEHLFETDPAHRAEAMLQRCAVTDTGTNISVSTLPERERINCAASLGEITPRLDLSMDLECPKCGSSFAYTFDPVRSLLGQLQSSRRSLLAEIHTLALYYHWSHEELLLLPRGLRREYLTLLEDDLSNGGPQ